MIDIVKIQRCGCEQDDCVEILGLETPVYACFTCGYAGVTPSSRDANDDEIHIEHLLAFYKRIKEIMNMEEIEEIVRVELIWTMMQEMIE
jgi:hypothetical protein